LVRSGGAVEASTRGSDANEGGWGDPRCLDRKAWLVDRWKLVARDGRRPTYSLIASGFRLHSGLHLVVIFSKFSLSRR